MNAQSKFRPTAHDREPSLLDVFLARCEARAIMVVYGMMHPHDAVDGLQAAAVAQGLVAEFGQDAIQQLMAQAFGRGHRRDD
jgi:hypothetical protein